MPLLTAGDFLGGFFFSFLGRIVSELGLVLRLPLGPCAPVLCSRATWGIDVTVSVSTVMLCWGVSAFALDEAGGLIDVVECLDVSGGGMAADGSERDSVLPGAVSPAVPVIASAAEAVLDSASLCRRDRVDSFARPAANLADASSKVCLGEVSGLASWTVSRVEVLPPDPRAGVLMPDGGWDSSVSWSD